MIPFLFIIMIIVSYLLGSINSAVMLAKIMGLPSPYTVGSGNPGATNMMRIGGKKAAALTLFFDALKGLIPVVIANMLGLSVFEIGVVALAAIIGHMYPLYFGFRGGKGVATLIGVMLGFNLWVGLIFIALWLVVAKLSKISSLSALTALLLTTLFIMFSYGFIDALPFTLMTILIFYRHHANIQRILNGTESKIGKKA